MKNYIFLTLLLVFLSVGAFGQKTESIYTSTVAKDCKPTPESQDDGYIGVCPGVGGYKLEVLEDDLRQTMNVVVSPSKKFELNLWGIVSSGFSSLGEKVEWLVTRKGKTVTPKALIVRFNVSGDPEDASKITSYLVVVKVSKTESCVTHVIEPSKEQNAKAREFAAIAPDSPCKTNE